jgi:ribose transport system ATP-binding protein
MRAGVLVGELDRDALDHHAVQESVFRLATALDATSTSPRADTDQETAS